MPKLKNVTQSEILTAEEEAFALQSTLRDIADRIRQGYCDDIHEPLSRASAFLGLSRAAADLAHGLLSKASNQEQAREIERLMRATKQGRGE